MSENITANLNVNIKTMYKIKYQSIMKMNQDEQKQKYNIHSDVFAINIFLLQMLRNKDYIMYANHSRF